MEHFTEEEMEHIAEVINAQEGQNYPCSNQVVLCGFFGSKEQFDEFCKDKTIIKVYDRGHRVNFDNGEKWLWSDEILESFRAYRYYKCKISKNIDKQKSQLLILPYCFTYCAELEWI